MKPKWHNTAKITGEIFCKDCGWPVVDACCNNEFRNFKDTGTQDWWYYCSNKGCKNHDGEGLDQFGVDWAFRATEEERR